MRYRCDVTVSGGATVSLFQLESPQARAWVEDQIHLESWQQLGRGLAVEHRYAGPLLEGMLAEGSYGEVVDGLFT